MSAKCEWSLGETEVACAPRRNVGLDLFTAMYSSINVFQTYNELDMAVDRIPMPPETASLPFLHERTVFTTLAAPHLPCLPRAIADIPQV